MQRLKINFLSHLSPFHYHGGGEQITRRLILEGRRRGYHIRTVFIQPLKFSLLSRITRFRKSDLTILFDVYNIPEYRHHFSRRFISRITEHGTYILGQNAYGDICNLNALPCNGTIGDGTRCVESKDTYFSYRANRSGWNKGRCPVNDHSDLFVNAALNVFLSPLHASIFHALYSVTKIKTFILEPVIDVDLFINKNRQRDIKYASYGGMSESKGFYNIRDRFPDEEIIFFGSNNKQLSAIHNYGKVIGRIPYEQMPDFLNRVEHYIHLPRWPEPHGLIVNQAALCGCELITNENVGALGHTFDIYDREHYAYHTARFWEKIEELMA